MTSTAPTLADLFRNFQLQQVGSVSSIQNEHGHVLGSAETTPSPVIETIFICHSDVWIFLWEKLNMNSAYNNISRHFNGEQIITLKSIWQYMNTEDDLMGALLFDSGLRDGHHTGGVTTWRSFDNILPSYFDKTTTQIAGKNACKFQIINDKIDNLLKTTSRSFYPTLKYLPKKVRGQIGLLYLLARVADTIADSKSGETDELLRLLRDYNDVAQGKAIDLPDFSRLAEIQENQHEAELLLNVQDVVDGLMVYSEEDRGRMLECLDIIVGGQILDLERFGPAKEGGVLSALNDNSELDDYTFRVAGCVGVFWTKMSLAHLITLPSEKETVFFEKGTRFGKALQMINILRDIPEDLRFGRCYIPEQELAKHDLKPEDLFDSNNIEKFRPLYDEYLDLTNEHLDAAIEYIKMLPETQFRLKASCMLPVLVGQRTVTLLRDGNILDSSDRIKVTRDEMKSYARKLLRALIIPGGVKRLLEKNKNS